MEHKQSSSDGKLPPAASTMAIPINIQGEQVYKDILRSMTGENSIFSLQINKASMVASSAALPSMSAIENGNKKDEHEEEDKNDN